MSHKHHNEHHHHDKKSTSNSNSHSHETFRQVELDETVKGHFDLVVPLADNYHQGKFKHVLLQHVFAQKNGHHDWFYWAQVKTGEFGDQHDWTVVFEIKDHHAILDSIHEGHKTFF
jgi:hypothetical protein